MDFSVTDLILVLWSVGVVIYFLIKNGKSKRKYKNTVLKSIKDCDGNVEEKIVAKVIQDTPLLSSPLYGKPCVYYEVLVQKRVSNPGVGASYESIIEEKSDQAFYLEDATGLAKLQPASAVFESEDESFFSSNPFNQPQETHLNFLNKHNLNSNGFLNINKSMVFIERIIQLGDTLTVIGKGSWDNVNNNQIQTKHKKIFSIRQSENSVLIIKKMKGNN